MGPLLGLGLKIIVEFGEISQPVHAVTYDHEELRRKVGGEHAERRSLIGLDVAGEEGHHSNVLPVRIVVALL